MKKNILVTALLAIATWILLPACGSNTDNNPVLQAPETTQTETPAATESAAPADTTAQPENPAGNKGKDSDEDDDDDDDRK